MFEKLTNRYYYGKSGKGDFTPSDLPRTRSGLFWEMLKIRLTALVRLNLIYVLCWIPAILVLAMFALSALTAMNRPEMDPNALLETLQALLTTTLLLLFPCIAITGPFTAGACVITRNWARDEHAFIWSDFKDAVRDNWKQSLVISVITGLMPLLCWICWFFYGSLAAAQPVMIVPQMIVIMLTIVWSVSVTYMHPLIVNYRLKLTDVIRNGLLLGIGRLPVSVGMRLLHTVPILLAVAAVFFWLPVWALSLLAFYYVLIGFTLSRFVSASVCNGVFDKLINSRLEGVPVNRGLNTEEDDDSDEE